MIPLTLDIVPNTDTQGTPFQVGKALTSTTLCRVKNGYLQKLGGSTILNPGQPFAGTATFTHPWAALSGVQYIGVGTTTNLQLFSAGVLTDITPAAGVGSGRWYMDNWGQNLVATPAGSTIYQWVPPIAGGNIAVPLTNAPSICNGLIVAAPQQQIIAWGIFSSTLSTQDPMLVGWCDVADNTDWTASTTNEAGTFRIPSGSVIQQIVWYGLSGVLWTDLDFWSMTYAGFPLVYSFNKIAPNCGLISSRAADILGTRMAWMSQNDFFAYQGGQVSPIPCSVRDFVFGVGGVGGLDRNFTQNIHCDTNTAFGEFMWRFPMIGSGGQCNGYAKWSPNETAGNPIGAWDFGEGAPLISSWSDQSVIGKPIGTDYTGNIQQFETANDFAGVTLPSGFTTGWFSIASGQEFIFLERFAPDFSVSAGGQVTFTIAFADEIPATPTDYPIRTYGPYTVDATTPFQIVRGRGRVAQITFNCTAADTFWRYGKPIGTAAIDGRQN